MTCSDNGYKSDEGEGDREGRNDVVDGDSRNEGGICKEAYRLQQRRASWQREALAMQWQGSR